MINGIDLQKEFDVLGRGDYYSLVAFEEIIKIEKLYNKNDIDVIKICCEYDEVTPKEADGYEKNVLKKKLSNKMILIKHVGDIYV